MAMPMRFVVRLQMRKSAEAGMDTTVSGATSNRSGMSRRAMRERNIGTGSLSGTRRRPGAEELVFLSARWSGVNEHHTQVVNVGAGRPRGQEIANAFEESGRIVVGEKTGGIETNGGGAGKRCFVDESAGGIGRPPAAAVGAVSIGGERRDPGRAAERQRQRQRIFLVGTAAAGALQRHRQLAAGDQCRGVAAVRKLPRMGGMQVGHRGSLRT